MNNNKIRKDIKKFLLSEEGKITKKKVIKMGIILGAVGSMLDYTEAMAQHSNYFHNSGGTGKHVSHGSHASHSSHSSHASHGSHSSHASHASY